MIQAILFMALVPLALLLVLAFTLLSGRMRESTRKRVELGLILITYPAFILTWAWQAWGYQGESDWLSFSMMTVLVVAFAVQFVVALRTRTLFPRYRQPKG